MLLVSVACQSAPQAPVSAAAPLAQQNTLLDPQNQRCGAALREHRTWFQKVTKCYRGTDQLDQANYCAEQFAGEHRNAAEEENECSGLPICRAAFVVLLSAEQAWVDCRRAEGQELCLDNTEADLTRAQSEVGRWCQSAHYADLLGP